MAEGETFDDTPVEFMSEYSRRIEAETQRPYDVCIQAGAALASSDLLLEATRGGVA